MYKDINDYELLYLIAENNEVAYNNIYDKYDNIIKIEAKKYYRKCKYLGFSLEDLYQAGLYGFGLALSNYIEQEGVLFYTYANTCITNEISSFIRDQARHKHEVLSDSISLDLSVDEDGTTMGMLVTGGVSVITEYNEYINCNHLLSLKHKLPLLQSLIFEMRLNNFSNQEIATLLDINYKCVDNALRTIKTKLKKELKEIELF